MILLVGVAGGFAVLSEVINLHNKTWRGIKDLKKQKHPSCEAMSGGAACKTLS